MNERIRELAVQAGAEFFQDTGMRPIAGGFYEEVTFENHRYLDLEQFAELIVRECAKISVDADQTFTNQGMASAEAFMEHFGVK